MHRENFWPEILPPTGVVLVLFFSFLQEQPGLSYYVCLEGSYHVAKGWADEMENDDHALTHLLSDVPQDELVLHAGFVAGVDRLSAWAGRAR